MVELLGEHDVGTAISIATALRDAAGDGDGGDVVVDLHAVTFMDASTIGALVDASCERRQHGHTLLLRSPSRVARRLLDLCDLSDMVETAETPPKAAPAGPHALTSWVAVPAADRPDVRLDERG